MFLLLFLAGVAAGLINSIAGGGSFFTFPALIFSGIPSIMANATSTIAVWPGTVASLRAYRSDIDHEWHLVPRLLVISLMGGLLGAVVLLKTPQEAFDRLLPWLLLFATLIFAFGGHLAAWFRGKAGGRGPTAPMGALSLLIQFLISTYAGYFGGGAGFLVLAMLSLAGMTNIHAMNGVRTLLGATANLVAIVAFAFAGRIVWPQALLMMVGTSIGGYVGAHWARRTHPKIVRSMVIALGGVMTIIFFVKYGAF
jgi:uncharacterized membrane protein YfcA